MMPNVVRGDRMSGLMAYLTGPGRHNEHTEPHLVAGDGALMAWHDDAELGPVAAASIARHLDRPRTAYGTDVPGGHVWHCSLSISAEEGELSDEAWGEIARDFITAMEFDDNDGSKAPCRWVAVRHGVSTNGNDHIHLAVNLVREDGTRASVHHDFHRAQKAARALEIEHGLAQLESEGKERSTRGYHPAEREAQARARARAQYDRTPPAASVGWDELSGPDRHARVVAELQRDEPRHDLARTVRGCATASESEDEFVRRIRRAGLLVRPRFADGRTDVVTGYSVAARPVHGERPIWYGGGHLGRDLTLPRLRSSWPDTPVGATAAANEWTAAKRGRRVVAPGREANGPDPQMWQRCTEDLTRFRDALRSVPIDDRDTWSRVARDTAGAFAAWSRATEPVPGPLAAAADVLSTSAQVHRRETRPKPSGIASLSSAAMLLSTVARGGRGTAAEAIMLRQLVRMTQAVYDAAKAGGDARLAAALASTERDHLRAIAAALPRVTAAPPATVTSQVPAGTATLDPEVAEVLQRVRAGHSSPTTSGSPVPIPVDPIPVRPTVRPGPDGGRGR